jgi:formate hydrogenlyase subunit 4
MLVLGASLFLPHGDGFAAQVAVLAITCVVLCGALAVAETVQAKMRILRVPALVGLGCVVALAGVGSWVAGVGM